MAKAKVCVVVLCWNQGRFLEDCLKSLYNQTYDDWESIVVYYDEHVPKPDLSHSPNTFTVLDHPCVADPMKNFAIAESRNIAVCHTKASYILMVDGDDMLNPEALELMASVLDAHPDVDVVCPNYVRFGLDSQLVKCIPLRDIPTKMPEMNGLCYSSMYRRSMWEKVCGYDESQNVSEDWALWVRFLKAGAKWSRLEAPTLMYRIHEGQITRTYSGTMTSLARKRIREKNGFAG